MSISSQSKIFDVMTDRVCVMDCMEIIKEFVKIWRFNQKYVDFNYDMLRNIKSTITETSDVKSDEEIATSCRDILMNLMHRSFEIVLVTEHELFCYRQIVMSKFC